MKQALGRVGARGGPKEDIKLVFTTQLSVELPLNPLPHLPIFHSSY